MATIQERLAERMRWWADEGNLGYDWSYPDRNHFYVGGETDCSSMVIHVCKECGLDVGEASYTGDMRAEFTRHGWRWIPGRPALASLREGDVLLREERHTAMYVGDGLISQASLNESGGTSGGEPGDQGQPNGLGETNTVPFNAGYPWDGVLRYEGEDPLKPKRKSARPAGNEAGGSAGPVYRLYNPYTGEHMFTQNKAEYDALAKAGWRQEGNGWVAPGRGSRVYRLRNPWTGTHLFTASLFEAQRAWDVGWESEGVCCLSGGNRAVWRLYNPYNGQHMLTTSNDEHASLVRAGWRQEGIGCEAAS